MAVPADNYIISRDTSEAERLEIQHGYMISCQGYYLHPDITLPDNGARIAELATGTSIFLREVAEAHPSAECHGFDISDKMFPGQAQLPPNVELHVANIKKPFESRWLGYFDVVHLRLVSAAMKTDDWGPTLRNIVTLLKPGGCLQWVEDDRGHAVRHACRPVAPLGAAKESLSGTGGQYIPPRLSFLDRFNRGIMPNDRADDMTYGCMNLDALMKDAEFGNLGQVGCDTYVIDRQDDGGELRKGWTMMGSAAVWSMLKSREIVGDKLTDLSRDELVQGFLKDMTLGGHFIGRATVFTGRKKA